VNEKMMRYGVCEKCEGKGVIENILKGDNLQVDQKVEKK
jgi:hypothetical protein